MSAKRKSGADSYESGGSSDGVTKRVKGGTGIGADTVAQPDDDTCSLIEGGFIHSWIGGDVTTIVLSYCDAPTNRFIDLQRPSTRAGPREFTAQLISDLESVSLPRATDLTTRWLEDMKTQFATLASLAVTRNTNSLLASVRGISRDLTWNNPLTQLHVWANELTAVANRCALIARTQLYKAHFIAGLRAWLLSPPHTVAAGMAELKRPHRKVADVDLRMTIPPPVELAYRLVALRPEGVDVGLEDRSSLELMFEILSDITIEAKDWKETTSGAPYNTVEAKLTVRFDSVPGRSPPMLRVSADPFAPPLPGAPMTTARTGALVLDIHTTSAVPVSPDSLNRLIIGARLPTDTRLDAVSVIPMRHSMNGTGSVTGDSDWEASIRGIQSRIDDGTAAAATAATAATAVTPFDRALRLVFQLSGRQWTCVCLLLLACMPVKATEDWELGRTQKGWYPAVHTVFVNRLSPPPEGK